MQAPRAVLVCYSCEALRQPGAREATVAAARELRGTLGTIAQSYGIRLPVYVLFTKSDDVPGRSRMYEAVVKGEPFLEPGLPESFNVLVKELQSLGLDVELVKTQD